MLHRDSIVQLTRDLSRGQKVLLRQGTAGRVVSTAVLHRECIVEFTVSNEQTTILRRSMTGTWSRYCRMHGRS
jgi:hypothetical protein